MTGGLRFRYSLAVPVVRLLLSLRMAICPLSGIHLPLSLSSCSSSLINVLNLYALFSFTGLCPHSSEREHNGKKESFPDWSTTVRSSKGCRPANSLNAMQARSGRCSLSCHSYYDDGESRYCSLGQFIFYPQQASFVIEGACSLAYWSNHSSLAVRGGSSQSAERPQLPSAPFSYRSFAPL